MHERVNPQARLSDQAPSCEAPAARIQRAPSAYKRLTTCSLNVVPLITTVCAYASGPAIPSVVQSSETPTSYDLAT